ncbi:MAG: glycosyltransferase family 2 protein, partial [Patescibacteria group bacterium]|nr:glycosyltransferase family 2 protein [Patescibacteria group bacterium]
IVGCRLIYPNSDETRENISSETIQHAGIVLGIGGIAGHAFRHIPYKENGYYALNKTIRNYNGVTGACAMIRRDVFDEIGGYDTNLKVSYMDVDLCLRVREKGYLIVYTPYSQLYHYESATRRKLDPLEDAEFLIKRWNHVLMKRDPYYNVNLSLLAENFIPSFCPIPIEITPLALLLEMYWARDDLPRAFPEVKQGNYTNLIKWAATYGISSKSYGLVDDQHGPILRHYKDWYVSNANINSSKISLKTELVISNKSKNEGS